jgi:diguanylate cyclase (GGDEF)-like protein/PAS domain S-box-containing protein
VQDFVAQDTMSLSKFMSPALALALALVCLVLLLALGIALTRLVQLKRSKRRFELMGRVAHDILWDWDLRSNLVWHYGDLARFFGISESEAVQPVEWWRQRIHPDDAERVWTSIQQAIQGDRTHWAEEYRLRRADREYVTVADRGFVLRNRRGKPTHVVGGAADISASRDAERRLAEHAFYDTLTGLPKRELFLSQLETAINRSHHSWNEQLAVLFLDLDRFKVVNDSLGHVAGDRLLVQVAERISECMREGDFAARFGGDEFTILLKAPKGVNAVVEAAGRIQSALRIPFRMDEQSIVITASIGIASVDSERAEEILRHAEIAMHRAKERGKARCAMFEPLLDLQAMGLLQLETELRASLDAQNFHLYYQPIISFETAELSGFEALIRWHHPTRGVLAPSDFLLAAEEAGLTVALGQWVFRESCRQLQHWRSLYPSASRLRMSVNLSGKEFAHPDLPVQLERIIEETRATSGSLVIELTESMITDSDEQIAVRLNQLRDLGALLAIDDFGKGYSSLARLQEFPISILKVDSQFVSRIDEGRPQIFDAILALSNELGLQVVAEGVETLEQFKYLKAAGAGLGQGLFFSPALDANRAEALLRGDKPWMDRFRKAESELEGPGPLTRKASA